MKRMKEPKVLWDEENKLAQVIIEYNDNVFVGSAQCHPDDYDMANNKTGIQIALMRAKIKYYIHLRDNEIKPGLRALNKLYFEMCNSLKYNPKSYETKSLKRNIYQLKSDLATIQDLIDITKSDLRQYIKDKDLFYKRIRANRKKDSVGQKSST